MINRKTLFGHVFERYGTDPDYLWPRYPGYAALRHPGKGGKWYAVVMDVPRKKLGLEGEGDVDVLNVKARPAQVAALLGEKGFLPAYHMNKTHWLSILLDGTVSLQKTLELLDASHALTRRA